MKILHAADIHIGAFPGPTRNGKNLRLKDTEQCMLALLQSAQQENPDIILISGDLFHRARLWADEMLDEIQIAVEWLNRLSCVAPVCLLYGTPNHDNAEAFNTINLAVYADVHIFMHPERRVIATRSGNVQICALPGFDRGYFRAQHPGVSREDENATFSAALTQIVMGLSAQCDGNSPAILMAHYTVAGADMESGQTQLFSQNEPMLPVDTMLAAGFHLAALGHIHKPQQVRGIPGAYYAGAINRLTFGDEGQKRGFWYHNLSLPQAFMSSDFVTTPAREFYTLRLGSEDVEFINQQGALVALAEHAQAIDNAIVRVLYSCSSAQEKALNKSMLERDLYALGAFWVQEITPVEITAAVDHNAMSEATTPEDNLASYLQDQGHDEKRINTTVELARPIIANAIANTSSKRSTGILRPVSIEVMNYRNYREASFDFSDVSMCTINGVNGAGKSSLFMDAIVDCLYEEPREGDLTGWIRADGDARSGAITFTFSIGDRMYRVARTRMRSGKATLNLSEHVDGDWNNLSCEKMRDTQDEIIDLLGMDIATFKSCALIMQDQYGIFLEAGKEQRMETLAAMLGLGIYEDMEEAAKVKATDAARDIRALKDQEDRLGDDLRREHPALEAKALALSDIESLSNVMDDARRHEGDARARVDRASEAQKKIITLCADMKTKQAGLRQSEQEHEAVRDDIKHLQAILENEDTLMEKANQYDAALSSLDGLNAEHLAAQRAYDAAMNRAQDNLRMQSDLARLKEKVEGLAESREQALCAAISLMPYEGSAAMCDETIEKIRTLEARDAERVHLECSLREATTTLERRDAEWDHILSTKKSEIETLRKRAALLENSKCIDPENARCVFLEDAIQSRDAIPALESALDLQKADAGKEIARLRMAEADLRSKLSKPDVWLKLSKLDDIPKQLAQLRTEHATLIQQAAQYERHGFYVDQMYSLDREMDSMSREIESLTSRIEAAADAGTQCEALYAALQEAAKRQREAHETVNSLRAYADQARSLPDVKARHNEALEREKRLGSAVLESILSCAQAQKDINELNGAADKLPQLKRDLDAISERIIALDRQKGEANARLGAAQKELEIVEQAKGRVSALRADISTLSETASLYADLKQAFSKDGIPHNIIRSIIPILESTANNILAQMTGGKMRLEFVTERVLKSNAKKEVTTLDIFIEESGRSRLPYLSKSGGEKVKISLSVVLALSEIMSRRAGIQLGFLHVDEPPFLDDLGTQAYCDALEAIRTRYPGHMIMAITHDQAMKSRFAQSIDVVRTEDGSKLVYA